MDYNLLSNLESCHIEIPHLLYYSHWPSIIISLFFGVFVFVKSKRSLASWILLFISIVFSLWASLSLIVWTSFDSRTISFFWSFFEVLSVLFYFLIFYFTYVFIEGKDISFGNKLASFFVFVVVLIVSSTSYYVAGFNAVVCESIENDFFLYFIYLLKALASILTVLLIFVKYFKYREDKIKKVRIFFVGLGSILLLLSFLVTQYSANLIFSDYQIEFYGLFAITVFMGFLAYLIVKYQAFDIKLLGTQALVAGLVILIGAELFFVESTINTVLVLITLAISIGFGYMLIKSVKSEVERKEQLQKMSDELARKNDQLRKLDNAKSEFISIASHQLRTPLTAIKGFISLLLEGSYGKLQSNHQEVLNKVYLSNERLIGLVEDLLNISRIESGRMEYKYDNWSIEKLCSEITDTFLIRAKERNLYLDYKKPEHELPMVMTDGSKLREVISNLVDNALKYTQRGGVSIRLSQEGENIQVSITDTGIGIPQEELPYLFSKFSRGKDTNRLNTGGTGLGLYVGKSIVEALGGKIWAESEGAGKGSRFIVEIPIEHKEEEQL